MDSMESKMRSTDRHIILKSKGDTRATSGLIDNRLFSGENILHLKMDPQTCFWSFNYDKGLVPEPLRSQFTGFKAALKYAEDYFKKRNVEIVEVKD